MIALSGAAAECGAARLAALCMLALRAAADECGAARLAHLPEADVLRRCGAALLESVRESGAAGDVARSWLAASSLARPAPRPENPRYLIAAALRNADSKGGIKRWCDGAFRLSALLKAEGEAGAFISVHEDGSTDGTKAALLGLRTRLNKAGVAHRIASRPRDEGADRIDRLARARNAALQPLYEDPGRFDFVVFVNDIALEPESLVPEPRGNRGGRRWFLGAAHPHRYNSRERRAPGTWRAV